MAKHVCTEFQAKFNQRLKIIEGAVDVFTGIHGIYGIVQNRLLDFTSEDIVEVGSESTTSTLTTVDIHYDPDGILLEYQLIESDYQFQEITLLHSKGLRFVQLLGKLPYEQPNPTDSVISTVTGYSIERFKFMIYVWNSKFKLAVMIINNTYEKYPATEQNSNDLKLIVALKKAANEIAAPINDVINAHNLYYANVLDNQVDYIHIFNQEENHV